mmetsp:Transcript_719/g.2959  ORF Transcript_719/g.2959 Transcript_719/m.2959 type:complete len:246 (-) Transcript_719:37-774(-)
MSCPVQCIGRLSARNMQRSGGNKSLQGHTSNRVCYATFSLFVGCVGPDCFRALPSNNRRSSLASCPSWWLMAWIVTCNNLLCNRSSVMLCNACKVSTGIVRPGVTLLPVDTPRPGNLRGLLWLAALLRRSLAGYFTRVRLLSNCASCGCTLTICVGPSPISTSLGHGLGGLHALAALLFRFLDAWGAWRKLLCQRRCARDCLHRCVIFWWKLCCRLRFQVCLLKLPRLFVLFAFGAWCKLLAKRG